MPLELARDDPGGLMPVGVPAYRRPNAFHELVERSLRAGEHCLSVQTQGSPQTHRARRGPLVTRMAEPIV
jgi:hypothetical protein